MTECCDRLSAHCQLQGLALRTSRPARLESVRRLAGSDSVPRYEQSGQVTSQSSLGDAWVPSLVTMECIAWVVSNSRTRCWGLASPWAIPAMALPGTSVGPAHVRGWPCPPHPILCSALVFPTSPPGFHCLCPGLSGCSGCVRCLWACTARGFTW